MCPSLILKLIILKLNLLHLDQQSNKVEMRSQFLRIFPQKSNSDSDQLGWTNADDYANLLRYSALKITYKQTP